MNGKILIVSIISLFSLNLFAAEKLECTAQFNSTTERLKLETTEDNTVSASHLGYDFDAFIYMNSINMVITKPVDKDGYRDSVSTSQVKPTVKDGNVNMFMNIKNELITFICKVTKK